MDKDYNFYTPEKMNSDFINFVTSLDKDNKLSAEEENECKEGVKKMVKITEDSEDDTGKIA